jgi:hypothetical protein
MPGDGLSIANPFGEQSVSWWRRLRQRRKRSAYAPKRYSVVAGGLGTFMGFGVAAFQGMDHDVRLLVIAGVTVLPSLLLEVWCKQRSRRRAEQMIMPSVK